RRNSVICSGVISLATGRESPAHTPLSRVSRREQPGEIASPQFSGERLGGEVAARSEPTTPSVAFREFERQHASVDYRFLTASLTTARQALTSGLGLSALASYSMEIMPWNLTSLSAFSTPGTSSTPLPKTTSVFLVLSWSLRWMPKFRL